MTLKTHLERLKACKGNIKQALESKGISLSGSPFSAYGEKFADEFLSMANYLKGDYPSLTMRIRSSVKHIRAGAFSYGKLKSFEGSEVIKIGKGAFCYSSIESIEVSKVTEIEADAFYKCQSLSSFEGLEVTTLGTRAMGHCASLTSISFPKVTEITADDVFYVTEKLKNIHMPQLERITGVRAFDGAGAGGDLSLPKLKECNMAAFRNNKFATIDLPALETIRNAGCFFQAEKVETLYLPELINANSMECFASMRRLRVADMPKLQDGGSKLFRNSSYLTEVNFPKLEWFGSYSFEGCSSLKELELPSVTAFPNNALSGCSLDKLILSGNEIPYLSTSALLNSPIENGGTGFVYVPDELVEAYKNHEQWSVVADQIKPISELEG